MVKPIGQHGGAWRFAAIGLLAATLSIGALSAFPHAKSAFANDIPGTLCGRQDLPGALYWGEHYHFEVNPTLHHHVWRAPGGNPATQWEEAC